MSEVSRVITHPSVKWSQHDIVVVIPCYNEWVWVLDTIHSAAVDAQKSESSIAVFVVVNNPSECDTDILEENKKTLQLVINILRNKKIADKQISWYDCRERIKMKEIRDSPIAVWIVDCYSERYALEVCNVWYARDVWTRSILPFLKSDASVIAHTDADCKIIGWYFDGIRASFFLQDNDTHIATWNRKFHYEEWQDKLKEQLEWIVDIEKDLQSFWNNSIIHDSFKVKYSSLATPGSHILFRKKIFIEVWWFSQIAWAEDILFWMKAQQLWYQISSTSSKISTLCRASDRTEDGHWFGFEIMRKSSQSKEYTPIFTAEYYSTLNTCIRILESCHESDNFRANVMKSPMKNILPDGALHKLADIYEEYTWGKEMKKYHITGILPYLHSILTQELLKIYPRKALHEALDQANTYISNDTDLDKLSKTLNILNISKLVTHHPGVWDNKMLIDYCACMKNKIYSYALLKDISKFIEMFYIALDAWEKRSNNKDIKYINGYESSTQIFMSIIQLLSAYWEKIIYNFIVENSSWEVLEYGVKKIEEMFTTWALSQEKIGLIDTIDATITDLNIHHWCFFPTILDFINTDILLKRYSLSD